MKLSDKKYFFIFLTLFFSHNIIHTSATTSKLPVVTRLTKNNLPKELQEEAEKTKLSILKPTEANRPLLYQNYPKGSLLFPQHAQVATKFDAMVATLKKNPDYIEFFRKIHINALTQLYAYLMKIYTNFNLTSPGCLQDTETPTANLEVYLNDEAKYATSKKKLIMNHFINLIQAQFGASIISYVPTTPPDMAVPLGQVFIHNDYGIDLNSFLQPQTDAAASAKQTGYFTFLKEYMDFFNTYTNYLTQADEIGITQYYKMADAIDKFLHDNKQTQSIIDDAADISKMNPTMFFYDTESMRAIQFIPFVANTIPKDSQFIPWASSIVNAALKKTTMNGHPLAYFKDGAGKITQNQMQAEHLYLLTETGPYLFEEELLAQPAWLNTKEGCIRILQACLGDFSVLVGLGILDDTCEKIILKALGKTSSATPQKTEKKK